MSENLIVERIEKFDEQTYATLQESFPDVRWNKEHLETYLSSDSNILLVAQQGAVMCGLVRAHVLPRYDTKKPEIILHEIDVSPSFRKQRVATTLVEALKTLAKTNEVSEIWMLTNRSNEAAMCLCQRCGAKAPHNDDIVFVYTLE